MSGGSSSGIAQLFSGSGTTQSDAQEYQNLAGGNISSLIDQLHVDQQSLAVRSAISSTQQSPSRSRPSLNCPRNVSRRSKSSNSLSETLSQVRGRIATLVHEQEVAEQKAQEAAFVARVAAERQAQLLAEQQAAAAKPLQQAAQQAQQSISTPTTTTSTTPPSDGSAGAAAVRAASHRSVCLTYGAVQHPESVSTAQD